MDFLEDQKEFVKDGNLKLNGVLFKVAPTLHTPLTYTKFNPNFRSRDAGKRPMSRGLTQGGIIQFASKALAQKGISSPTSAKSCGKNKKATDPNRHRKRNKSFENTNFMIQQINNQPIRLKQQHNRDQLQLKGTKKP